MDLAALRIGAITSGRLSYGQRVRQQTAEAHDFHVNMPVRGHAVSRCGQSEPVRTTRGQGLVFSPEAPAEIAWSPDCVQLCLMIPRAGLEAELERLLGRSVRSRLRFDFGVAPEHGRRAAPDGIGPGGAGARQPSGLATSPVAGRHLEGLVLDGLLLGQSHNYSDAAVGSPRNAPSGVIRRAVELIEEQPGEAWTTVGLATELHLSVRALQAGFKRELGTAPMAYLRLVRLRRAHAALRDANPAETTVQAVAWALVSCTKADSQSTTGKPSVKSPSETLHR